MLKRVPFDPRSKNEPVQAAFAFRLGVRKQWARSLSSMGGDVRRLCCADFQSWSFKPVTFFLPPSKVLLWLSLVLFPGFIVVVSREEQREAHLCHLFWEGSQKTGGS